MSSKIVLLSQLDAISNVPGIKFSDNDRICIIPVCCRSDQVTDCSSFTSFYGPNGDKGKRFRRTLFQNGAKEENLFFVNYYDPHSYQNCKRILSANYILLPGGLMELGVERLKKTNLDIVLSQFSGTIICFSAGGIMLFDKYIIVPNPVYRDLEIVNGIGLLDSNQFVIDVHFDDTNLEQIAWLEKACNTFHKTIYAISQLGYIVIEGKHITSYSGARVFKESISSTLNGR